MCTSVLGLVDKSLERIEESRKEQKEIEEDEDEGEEFDAEDATMFKEEVKQEYELQIGAAELLGIIMKTHPGMVHELITTLRKDHLQAAFSSNEPKRQKFGLFILDDIVEHLGPAFFTPGDFSQLVTTVCSFVNNSASSIRQAAAYGIGVIAQNSGPAFANNANDCLAALKAGIDLPPSSKTTAKKDKLTQFHHARDNAIASLGKILKYQNELLLSTNAQLFAELVQ